jgi:tetratricopeptide (TPR) repeat protein
LEVDLMKSVAIRVGATVALPLLLTATACSGSGSGEPPAAEPASAVAPRSEPTTAEKVAFWQERTETNPRDYLSLAELGQSLSRQARETGDLAQYVEAEGALRRALALNPDYEPAATYLASVRFSQHEFADALALAEPVYAADPNALAALAVVGDARLELGDYAGAGVAYDQLSEASDSPAALSRLARLARLRGDDRQATTLAREAATEARAERLHGEAGAFFEAHLAEELFARGRLRGAARHFEAARELLEYHVSLEGLARVRAAQGHYDEARALYDQVRTPPPDVPLMIAIGDLAAVQGDQAGAERQYAAVETATSPAEQEDPLNARLYARFYADHERRPGRALELARIDLARRADVFGYDTLAWALYRNGRFPEAADAITTALASGTRDAVLLYHAGMIAAAQGNDSAAVELLDEALTTNPHFDLLQADMARATLQELT